MSSLKLSVSRVFLTPRPLETPPLLRRLAAFGSMVMVLFVLLQAALALRPVPLFSGRRLPLAPRRAPCRCSRVCCDFSPAYDTTIRYAAQ